jgi:hypothetical protein
VASADSVIGLFTSAISYFKLDKLNPKVPGLTH